jgi:DNA polymerase-1
MLGKGMLYEGFLKGIDLHKQTAELLGSSRDVGKTVNFATIYGAGPKKLAQQIGTSDAQARKFSSAYKKASPEIDVLRKKILDKVRQTGVVRTLGGRRRSLDLQVSNIRRAWSEERKAFNTPIQGGAADIVKLAMLEAHKRGLPMIVQVHDEIGIEVEDRHVDPAKHELQDVMENVCDIGIPLIADSKSGKTWLEAK